MAKHLFKAAGVVASLGIAALPILAASAVDEAQTTTHVRIAVSTSVACSSSDGDIDNPSDIVNMGEIAPGTATTAPTTFFVTGSTNSLTGFTITGDPTDLVHEDYSTEKFVYKYGSTTPSTANWWVTTVEQTGVTIGEEIVLTSASSQADFELGANAAAVNDTAPGNYAGTIDWVCAIQ